MDKIKILYRVLVCMLLVGSFGGAIQAQDIHFSHYRGAPLITNPANTGAYKGDFQFASIYRNQWRVLGNPFQTFAASYDQKLYILPGDLAVGLIAATDKGGNAGLTQTKLMVSGAYHYKLGKGKIGAGLQAGMVWKSYDNDISFPQQYSRDSGTFDTALANGETTLRDQLSYFDLNVGAVYRSPTNWGDIHFGFAAMHLTTPSESFLDRTNPLPVRSLVEMRSEIRINEKVFATPGMLMQVHNKAQEVLPSCAIGTYLAQNSFNAQKAYLNLALRDGFERNGDSFILIGAVDFKFVDAAIRYDITYSDLSAATRGRGAIEFSFIYRGLSSELAKKIVPCDRY